MYARSRLTASLKKPYIPGWYAREKITVDLSGTHFSMELPPHSHDPVLFEPHQSHFNLYDDSNFDSDVGVAVLYKRAFSVHGSVFYRERLGYCDVQPMLDRVLDLPEGMSCFNPAHFEQVIERFLHHMHGPDDTFHKQYCLKNWKNLESGIYVEAHESNNPFPDQSSNFSAHFFTPLDHRLYLRIGCVCAGYEPTTITTPMVQHFIRTLIASVRVTLSAPAMVRQTGTLVQVVQKNYRSDTPDYQWRYPKFRKPDIFKGEFEPVLITPGSPAPVYRP